MALIALPLTYGKVRGPGCTDDDTIWIFGTESNLCFWRSIIMSSLGKTLYPYCLWIKTLDILDLQSLLLELLKVPDLRQKFYSPPLDYLEVLDKSNATDSVDKPGSKALLFEVTNEVTKYIKSVADQGHGSAKLFCLQDPHLGYSTSSVYFPVWASRLASLTTLHVVDGSCVGDHIALSLAENRPAFKHLYVYQTPLGGCSSSRTQRRGGNLGPSPVLLNTDHSPGLHANAIVNEADSKGYRPVGKAKWSGFANNFILTH